MERLSFKSAGAVSRRHQIASLKRRITEAEHYCDTHPDASAVSEELKELRAELADLGAAA